MKKNEIEFKPLSPIEAVHYTANGLYQAGIIDGETMRQYDNLCFSSIPKLNAQEIKHVRLASKVSQAVFAKLLNVSASTVKQWELGKKNPQGAALKLLSLVKIMGINLLRH